MVSANEYRGFTALTITALLYASFRSLHAHFSGTAIIYREFGKGFRWLMLKNRTNTLLEKEHKK